MADAERKLLLISNNDLNLIRQWFNSIYDTNTSYLYKEDYQLAMRINKHLGMQVPKAQHRSYRRADKLEYDAYNQFPESTTD